VRYRRENGIALVTSILILLLLSTMIAGFAWMIMGDRALGGNYQDRQLAFYGAEAGMESLTAALENLFNANYAPTAASITGTSGIVKTAPSNLVPGVSYLNPDGSNGYVVLFPTDSNGNPKAGASNISHGTYAGLQGLMTPYTIQVTARTPFGSEVRLTRDVQTVAIPVFQFGVFSATDLDYFAEPPFNFGGRVHSNGNLWLAEVSGNTLTMGGAVTAGGEIITSNLENGYSTSSIFAGPVKITTGGAGYADLRSQSPAQSVTGTSNHVGSVSAYNTNFASMASGVYGASNLAVKETGGKVFNVSIATPQIGGQEIDMIRRPVHGEDTSNNPKLLERYWTQVGMRILLSDYGADGTCSTSDISSTSSNALPGLSANITIGSTTFKTPVDLATLAWDASDLTGNANSNTLPPPYNQGPLWMTGLTPNPIGTNVWPLPTSGASGASYSSTDGYWVKQYYPIMSGCIKIDYQNSSNTWTDVTDKVLELGFTGENIHPLGASWQAPPTLVAFPSSPTQVAPQRPVVKTGVTTVACTNPSANAVIRLARVRDNPSSGLTNFNAGIVNPCGTPPTTAAGMHGSDFWPNALYDSREGELVDITACGPPSGACGVSINPPLAGTMYYVELDIANLAACLTGTAAPFSTYCSWASNVTNSNGEGYSIYFSDRRTEQSDHTPPASVGGTDAFTGGYGYDDIVNPSSANGCPDGSLQTGEDLEGDYTNGVDSNPPSAPRTFGNFLNPPSPRTAPTYFWPMCQNGCTTTPSPVWNLPIGSPVGSSFLSNNPYCSAPGVTWPFAIPSNAQAGRENPALFFRRALKIVNGSAINIGAANACNGVNCGLTLVSENPAYVQGDFNNNPNTDATFATPGTDAHVGTSIVADAITALSDNWNDVNSFIFPYNWGGRAALTTTYRFAFMAGLGVPFQQPSRAIDVAEGTDGGVHNLLRYIERWNTATDIPFSVNSSTAVPSYYLGSMVSTYYDHQAVAIWKCCGGSVYDPPQRNYTFDQDFQTPAKLPPLTPMLRDINTIGYTQLMLPTQ
jgi:PilX N-terminal